MGVPSGTFSNLASGRLQVTFGGDWVTNTGADFGTGVTDMVLRGYVGSGESLQSVILNINVHSGVVERDYVGGTSVPVGMELVSSSLSGPASITAKNLRVTCRLFSA
ncbi:MAG: hypothetical protein Q8K45_01885 [Rubrivivax sp.]|nr:hypothetical protein [Rubrivivax sp.]